MLSEISNSVRGSIVPVAAYPLINASMGAMSDMRALRTSMGICPRASTSASFRIPLIMRRHPLRGAHDLGSGGFSIEQSRQHVGRSSWRNLDLADACIQRGAGCIELGL